MDLRIISKGGIAVKVEKSEKIYSGWQRRNSKEVEVRRETHLYCFKPAWLLHLVVDDRLVLIDPLISSSREDNILNIKKENTQIVIKKCDWLSGYTGITLGITFIQSGKNHEGCAIIILSKH